MSSFHDTAMANQKFKDFLSGFVLMLSSCSLSSSVASYIIFLSFGFLLFGFSETSRPLSFSLSTVSTAVAWLPERCLILSTERHLPADGMLSDEAHVGSVFTTLTSVFPRFLSCHWCRRHEPISLGTATHFLWCLDSCWDLPTEQVTPWFGNSSANNYRPQTACPGASTKRTRLRVPGGSFCLLTSAREREEGHLRHRTGAWWDGKSPLCTTRTSLKEGQRKENMACGMWVILMGTPAHWGGPRNVRLTHLLPTLWTHRSLPFTVLLQWVLPPIAGTFPSRKFLTKSCLDHMFHNSITKALVVCPFFLLSNLTADIAASLQMSPTQGK